MNSITPNYNNNVSFKSIQNPVKPFKMATKLGDVTISELKVDEAKPQELLEVLKVFCDNISESIDTPFWRKYKSGTKEDKIRVAKSYGKGILNSVNDPEKHDNVTFLVARDKNNAIKGAHYALSCTSVPGCKDTTLYLHSGAVALEYRGQGIAGSMVKALLDSGKDTYTDAYVTCSHMAKGMIAKSGFKPLDPTNPNEKEIINYLKRTRKDYPSQVTAMHKALQPDKPRWTEGAAEGIKEWKRKRPFILMKKAVPYAIKLVKYETKNLLNKFSKAD